MIFIPKNKTQETLYSVFIYGIILGMIIGALYTRSIALNLLDVIEHKQEEINRLHNFVRVIEKISKDNSHGGKE